MRFDLYIYVVNKLVIRLSYLIALDKLDVII